ncbi:MAG: histidinol-phosphatase family [Halanaerobiales bacterium]|nr:histidinol-phosphatase family [Halanaerobiales bacterium]
MFLVDYHTHPYAHGEDKVKPAHKISHLKNFISKAEVRGVRILGFSDHDRFLNEINWNNLQKIKDKSNTEVCLGIEFDYRPEKEERIRKLIADLTLDYTIGSVHAIGDWEVDHPDYIEEYDRRNITESYYQYFDLVRKAALSGLFNIIGHLDLIKIFGFKPADVDIISIVEPVLKTIKDMELVIEVNTNGFNKPVKEQYPSEEVLRRAYELGIPVTFGSDAHGPERVGERIKEVARLIKKIGFKEVAIFRQGEVRFSKL